MPVVESNANVLLVDDHAASLLSLHALLDGLGYNLVDARSGEEALRRMKTDEFAVVLLDVVMPGISGFETARLIRSQERSRHTPIIFLSAHDGDRALLEEGYALGAVDFLTKPPVALALQAKVRGFAKLFQDRKRAEHEADQLRLLVQGTKDYAIFMLDPSGVIVTWNSGAERLKGYQAEEIIGQHFSRFYPPDAIARKWPQHELEVAEKVGRFEDEGWRLRKDGTRFWANVVITALRDSSGELKGFSKVTRDLTERRQSEENSRRLVEEELARKSAEELATAIHEQREQLRVTLQSIGDGVIAVDNQGSVRLLNTVAQGLTGWSAEDAIGMPLSEVFKLVNEHTREPVENPALQALATGLPVELANHSILIGKSGEELPIDDSAAPIRDERGTTLGAVLVFRNVSDQRHAAEQILRSEQRFARFMQHLPGLAWIKDLQGCYVYANDAAVKAFGTPRTELYGKTDGEVFPPETAAQFKENDQKAISSGTGVQVVEALGHEGLVRHSLVSKFPITNPDGQVTLVGGMAIDITEQRRMQQALKESERLYRAIGESINYGVWVCDEHGRNIYCSDSFLRLVGMTQEQCSAHSWGGILDPEDAAQTTAAWNDCVRRGGDWDAEHRVKGVDGQWHSILARGVPVRNERGDITAWAGINLDISRLKQVEDKLRDADRRKDEFLATLAHELRNPLAPIRNSLQILKMPQIDPQTAQQTREMMDRQVHHLVRLVDDLLDVSRVMRGKIELRREKVELATVVARAVETAKPLIEVQGHQLDVSVPNTSLLLDADPVRLSQVIGNLLTNSAKYTDANGHIDVTATRQGAHVVLSVRDNGIGIAPDLLPHIFELFVQADHASTKSQGGLGIGLTLVKNLVEMHGGSVDASSGGLGKGSEFNIRLPLVVQEPTPGAAVSAKGKRAAVSSGFRLLVVDDNTDGALSLSMLLRLQGHEVRVAHDGAASLDIATDFRPDVVFLDLGMPVMDGYEVARRLRKTPGLEQTVLVALTGWGQQEDRRRTAEAGFNYHLVKPAELTAIDAVLADLKAAKGNR